MTEPLRVGDAERAHAVSQLEQQAALGRLDGGELAERTRAAEAAVYDVDLDALFRDLPGGLAPLPENHWETFPGASGVSDRPAQVSHQELAPAPPSAPVYEGDVMPEDTRDPRAGSIVGGVSVGGVLWVISIIMVMFGIRYWWVPMLLAVFVGPMLWGRGRSRRDRR